MIRLLQKKFVTTAMVAITALILVMLAAINVFNLISTNEQIENTIKLLTSYDGDRANIPKTQNPQNIAPEGDPKLELNPDSERIQPNDEDTFLSTSFFSLRLDSDNNVVYVNTEQIPSIDDATAKALGAKALSEGGDSGMIGQFRYVINNNNFNSGKSIVFLDVTKDTEKEISMLLISSGVGLICWLLMLGLTFLLSKKAIHPIAENIQRQKQFVTNAGHELKTPLAIILANTEAMELFNEENKWTKNIKSQVARLSELTKNLLTLAKMDEYSGSETKDIVSLSDIVTDGLASFSEAFLLKNISIANNIQKNVNVNGEKNQIKELVSILLDNAVKYTNDNGTFSVSLYLKGKKVLLNMSNTCEHLPDSPANNLFERFYRGSEARTQKTSGQGIGLAVASSIVSNHGGSITASYTGSDIISFQVILQSRG